MCLRAVLGPSLLEMFCCSSVNTPSRSSNSRRTCYEWQTRKYVGNLCSWRNMEVTLVATSSLETGFLPLWVYPSSEDCLLVFLPQKLSPCFPSSTLVQPPFSPWFSLSAPSVCSWVALIVQWWLVCDFLFGPKRTWRHVDENLQTRSWEHTGLDILRF